MFNFMRSHVSFASCALVWLACSANECAADTLIITSEVRFSELDGSSDDNDGMANGVLALSGLGVGGGGRLLLDVPRAVLELDGSLVLWLDGSIRTPPSAVPAIGPTLTVRAGASILLVANSAILATGSNIGGAVFLCAPRGIGLWHNASISTGDAPDATSSFGGFIGLQSARAISLNSANTRISADGLTGGAVRLVTCGLSPNSVLIRGTVSAIGIERRGGSVEIEARQGGIVFDRDSGSIDATGASADGTVSLTAGTTVNPVPPPVDPQPLIQVGQPASEPCDDCAFDFGDDCNRNGIPDDQDLDECTGDPACDDCNLNGVLDACDIASGNSLDVSPMDGVPDECSEFTGGCAPPTENWSCFGNWDLGGDAYPDDLASAQGVHVTLGAGDGVLLDVSVLIPTLRLLDGALLKMTQAGAQGDLGFSAPATLLNQGTIHVAHDRVLGADGGLPPSIVFGAGGTLTKDPTSLVSASALLRGAELVLEPGSCAAQRDGAHLELVDDMSVVLDGDLVLEGASFADCSAVNRTSGGVTPPPKLGAQDSVTIDLGGALRRNAGPAAAGNGAAPGTLTLGSVVEVAILPDAVVRVRGDFNNRSVSPGLFNWINGTLVMHGDAPQRFEVAGVDVGATLEGFQVDAHTNFSMKTLRIAANSDVTFENRIANTVSDEPCAEAWYVRHLILEPGANMTLDNCRVYYLRVPSWELRRVKRQGGFPRL